MMIAIIEKRAEAGATIHLQGHKNGHGLDYSICVGGSSSGRGPLRGGCPE